MMDALPNNALRPPDCPSGGFAPPVGGGWAWALGGAKRHTRR
jgi:hypothetical protein